MLQRDTGHDGVELDNCDECRFTRFVDETNDRPATEAEYQHPRSRRELRRLQLGDNVTAIGRGKRKFPIPLSEQIEHIVG